MKIGGKSGFALLRGKMAEEAPNAISLGLSIFMNDYRLEIDFGEATVIWVTLTIISVFCLVLFRIAEKSEALQQDNEATEQISFLEAESENKENEKKNDIMVDYRKSARALHTAAERCYMKENVVKCIEIVSKYPPLINVKCPISGLTPFHRVCFHRNACLISFMLSHGADYSMTTTSNENALCLLIRSYLQSPTSDFACLKILESSGCHLDPADNWYKIFLEAAIFTANKPLALWIMKQSSSRIQRQRSFP